MKVSKATRLELDQIFDPSPEKQKERRSLWASYKKVREEFLQQLRKQGLKGKQYSDAVIEWDREHRDGFQHMFYNVRGEV